MDDHTVKARGHGSESSLRKQDSTEVIGLKSFSIREASNENLITTDE